MVQNLTRWCVATELFEILPKESLYAGETEMCQPRAGVEKLDNALYNALVGGLAAQARSWVHTLSVSCVQ